MKFYFDYKLILKTEKILIAIFLNPWQTSLFSKKRKLWKNMISHELGLDNCRCRITLTYFMEKHKLFLKKYFLQKKTSHHKTSHLKVILGSISKLRIFLFFAVWYGTHTHTHTHTLTHTTHIQTHAQEQKKGKKSFSKVAFWAIRIIVHLQFNRNSSFKPIWKNSLSFFSVRF